jgi:transcriptional regulator with XRE-family HTH domain
MLDTTDAIFGQRLRLERERRRITLASIAANTKISLYLLEGLERGQLSRWPSGIFRRSFIRAYAEAIGLDPDEVMREFLERFPDPPDLPFQSPPPEARRIAANEPVLRLNLADLDVTSTRGKLLVGMRPRWAAVAWDVCVLLAVGLMLFVALNRFWMPFAIATLAYYGGSILLLGNTPGVSLFAPVTPDAPANRFGVVQTTPSSLFKTLGAAFRSATGRRGEAVNR